MTTTSTSTPGYARVRSDEAARLLGQTMGFVALTAACFALGAYLGRDLSAGWAIGAYIGSFVVLLAMSVAAQRSELITITLLFGFGLVLGLAVDRPSATSSGRIRRRCGKQAQRRHCSSRGSG